MSVITIGKRQVGAGHPAFIIAELSANHHQNFDHAVRIIQAAKNAGADAIKLQTYTPDTITIQSDRENFKIRGGTLWDGRTLHDLYEEAYTPWEWQPKLKQVAEDCGLVCFSSPFDSTAVDFLERMDVPAYKVASSELVDMGLIQRVARTGKPVIMSTGMAALDEIVEAVEAAKQAGANEIALLKCTSAYPALPAEMNLKTIPDMMRRFNLPVGISDHSLTHEVAITAVALGACIVEKHLALSRSTPGPDSAFSLEPEEFKAMVDAIRLAESAMGEVSYQPSPHEVAGLAFRRSLFVVQTMQAGEVFTADNVRSIRPGNGLHTRHLPEIIGRRATHQMDRGTPVSWDAVAEREI